MSRVIRDLHSCWSFDVVIHDPATCPEPEHLQAKYLVHGYDDVLWTDDPEAVVQYLRQELERAKGMTKP